MREVSGVEIDDALESDLEVIMREMSVRVKETHGEGSFQRLFWDEQLRATKSKSTKQVRWHPAMIKWCLSLKLLSSSTYHALRSSGVLVLPSERTLRDYTHWIEADSGFVDEVDDQLRTEVKIDTLKEYQKHICLLFDEVKIREDLVYDKHSFKIIGFVNLGRINNRLLELEKLMKDDPQPSVARNMLVFMVRGLFLKIEFPYAQFPCSSLSGDMIYPLVWECISRLEACGFKVLALTADGASCNRKFFKMHSQDKCVYKTENIYSSDKRPLFFISDVPHLMKTVRNCWANSFAHRRSRRLRVSLNLIIMIIALLLLL